VVDPAAVVDPAKPVDPPPPNPEEDKDAIRVRLRRDSFETETDWKVAQKAMDFIRAGMTPAKAEAAAKEHLGIKADAPAPVETATPEVEAFQTVTKTLEDKEAERDAALLAYDNEKVVALNKEIRTLTQQATKAERAVETARAAQASYQQSIQRSITEYPESNVPGSKLYKAIAGRFATMDANDPLWQNPNRAEIVAKEEAAELGIKGKSAQTAATPPSATPAKPSAATKPQKVSPVPGSARTTIPAVTPEVALDAELKKALGKNAHVLQTIS
jgi:hypothetical protein